MPSPKSGSAPGPVSPAAPKQALDADNAKPGEMANDSGNQTDDSANGKPYSPDKDKTSWIEIVMIDEQSKPVRGMAYEITLADGATIAQGTLDENGFARIDGIDPGSCKITFPKLDEEAWEKYNTMPEDHVIAAGECFSSLSFERGFFWKTLWNHPNNQELKSQRKDPNILIKSDIVHIPDLRVKKEDGETEKRHTFKLKGVPAKLKLRVMHAKLEEKKKGSPSAGGGGSDSGGIADMASELTGIGGGGGGGTTSDQADPEYQPPKWKEEPIKNAPYELEVDGQVVDQGMTDGDGCVQIPLIPNAKKGKLIVNRGKPEEKIITLGLGGMDPVDKITGVRMRLKNLGFMCALEGPADQPELKEAVRKFQERHALETTGVVDSTLQAKLKEIHGS